MPRKMPYTVFLVDDHELFREGMAFLLKHIIGAKKVLTAPNGETFLSMLNETVPDLVFMDINMPGMGGIEATSRAMALFPELRIIALTMHNDQKYHEQMMQAGARGLIIKDAAREELKIAVTNVMNDYYYFCPNVLNKIVKWQKQARTNIPDNLTVREKEILELICGGKTNKEIAGRLCISLKTVEGHKTNLLHKTGCKNSMEAALQAFKSGLINLD